MFNKFISKKLKILDKCKSDMKFISNKNDLKQGLIFTLYSDKSNLLEVGFAKNNRILENKLLEDKYTLLDKKSGSLNELKILKETLNQLGILIFDNKYYKYSNTSIRHLDTLGWPVGKSIYKQRSIRKRISHNIN